MKSKAVVFPALDMIEVRDVVLPPIKEDEFLAETIYSYVSPGTELRTLAGYYGAKNNFPLVPGYSNISRVLETGRTVSHFKTGDIIAARSGGAYVDVKSYFGGQSAYHVYHDDPSVHLLLPAMSDEELLPYTVTEVAAISYKGVRMADPQKGDDVLVIGQGMIGRFSAEFFRIHGGIVTVCDVDEKRLAEAAARGFDTVDLKDEKAKERLACHACDGFDIVVECSGSTPGVETAYSQVKKPAASKSYNYIKNLPKLVMQATYVEKVPINPAYFFPSQGVILITPYDRDFSDRKMVVDMIRKKELDVADCVKNIFTPDEFVGAYRKLQNHEISSAVFKWK